MVDGIKKKKSGCLQSNISQVVAEMDLFMAGGEINHVRQYNTSP